jgi:hypothetical protein
VSVSVWEDLDGCFAVRETLDWLSPAEFEQR